MLSSDLSHCDSLVTCINLCFYKLHVRKSIFGITECNSYSTHRAHEIRRAHLSGESKLSWDTLNSPRTHFSAINCPGRELDSLLLMGSSLLCSTCNLSYRHTHTHTHTNTRTHPHDTPTDTCTHRHTTTRTLLYIWKKLLCSPIMMVHIFSLTECIRSLHMHF